MPFAAADSADAALSIADVVALGGDQTDYDMLRGIDNMDGPAAAEDGDEVEAIVDPDRDDHAKSIDRNEVAAMLKTLGLSAAKTPTAVTDAATRVAQRRDTETPVRPSVASVLLLAPLDGPWYAVAQRHEAEFSTSHQGHADVDVEQRGEVVSVAALAADAAGGLEAEAKLYEQRERRKVRSASDERWLQTMLVSGTMSDRLAALALLVQESPPHQLNVLDKLLAASRKKSRREALMACDALKDLFLEHLLPDRKLRAFTQHPWNRVRVERYAAHGDASARRLLLWRAFEDALRERYTQLLDALEVLLRDAMVSIREKAVQIVYELLIKKPEQERRLLAMLVNKLGDPDRRLASRVIFWLLKLLQVHPGMKLVVSREMEQLIWRPNVDRHAQYYAFCCLNQIVLSHEESAVAHKLTDIYFAILPNLISAGQMESRMVSALLTGINRAFPFADISESVYDQYLDALFRAVHTGPFSAAVQAVGLLYRIMESRRALSDRFFRVLYQLLLDVRLHTTSQQALFLTTVTKAICADTSAVRVQAMAKRLLQSACAARQPQLVCAELVALGQIVKERPALAELFVRSPASLLEDAEEEHFVDVQETDATDDRSPRPPQPARPPAMAKKTYDATKRDPLYAGAEMACTWELVLLTQHFHPSVAHFTTTLLREQALEYPGDALEDFSLMRFLDRCVACRVRRFALPSLSRAGVR